MSKSGNTGSEMFVKHRAKKKHQVPETPPSWDRTQSIHIMSLIFAIITDSVLVYYLHKTGSLVRVADTVLAVTTQAVQSSCGRGRRKIDDSTSTHYMYTASAHL